MLAPRAGTEPLRHPPLQSPFPPAPESERLSPMRKLSVAACVSLALLAPLAAQAQNVAIVNGKPVPKARLEALITQVTKQGQPRTPELEKQARDEVVMREMFMQEAEKRGLAASPDYKTQMEFARQTILIRELFEDEKRKHPI